MPLLLSPISILVMDFLPASTTTVDLPPLTDKELAVTDSTTTPEIDLATTSELTASELTAIDFDPFVDGEILLTAPATESQKEIWLGVQLSDLANLACLLSQTLKLTGSIDLPALQAAIDRLVSRHESLRTTFSGDGMTMMIAKQVEVITPVVDLSALTDSQRATEIAKHQQQAVSQAFDLNRGPLFRAKIIKVDDREHLVILTVHHIVCDGWSLGIIASDLGRIYSDLARGIEPRLDPPEYFSEYAFLEQEQIGSVEAIEIERYWLKKFENLPPALDLPLDYPRPPLRTFNSDREYYTLRSSLVKSIEQVGIEQGCSLMTTLLAAFEVFLSKLTDQTDLTVGVPTSGQIAAGKYNLVGHCVNFLPVRTQIDPECKFDDYLRSRNSSILDDYEHQDFTFGSLLKKLSIPRDASRIPLVSVVFNLDLAASDDRSQFDKLDVEISANRNDFATFEFFLNGATTTNGEIVLNCQYNTNLYTADTIRRRLMEFENLLADIVDKSARPIRQLSLLSTAQLQQMLVEWNDNHTTYPQSKCIHHLFEEQVERTPDNIAIVFEDQQLTYRELNHRANQLAHYLQTRGVGKDVLVGLYLERSIAMVVGLWGILKAGGAYVPLDPAYPQARVAYILADSQAKVLISEPKLLASLPAHQAEVVVMAAKGTQIALQPHSNPLSDTQPENLAYVIYTSGSTGNPKGVEVCHQSQLNLLHHLQQSPGLTSRDTLLAVTTICFDTSTVDMYLPLTVGAKIVLVSSEIAADGFQLLAKLIDSSATFMQATPVSFRLLLAAGWEGSPHLRIVSTGEALPRNLADRLLDKVAELWDLYGPTETTVWSTGSKINDLRQAAVGATAGLKQYQGALELIGKPIANTQAYILDRYLQPVPIGTSGELHIGGVCLAKGYRNRPDLTAEKFIANPFSQQQHDRIYKTGDLARYLPDGNIEYLGRIDNQVKIRGFRIELGEIEALLVKYPQVKEVTVIDREDPQGDRCLVAYLVTEPQANLDESASTALTSRAFRAFLQPQIPDYMIPAAFVMLETLPLTPNGKVDRRALPAPEYDRQESHNALVAPRDEIELHLAEIWKRILGVKSIGIRDNFFELGGNSLIAVRLFAEIKQIWARNLPLATLLQKQTIEELAVVLRHKEWVASWSSLVLIQSGGANKPPLFCIHPVGGNILEYSTLANYLDRDQPVYGLQSQGLDGNQPPFCCVEDMADHYIKEMRTIQPEGPYFLTGYSFGGLVAYEIAQQLYAQGQKTALLALLDTSAPNLPNLRPSLLRALGIHLSNLCKLEPPERSSYILDRLDYRLRSSNNKEFLAKSLYKPEDLTPQLLAVLAANLEAGQKYLGRFYPGEVTLLRCHIQDIEHALHPEFGWSKLVGKLNIQHIPGPHFTMLKEPRIRSLAEKLEFCLRQVQAGI
jgi:amino acid adenylation domain-containing protein